jgi:hypothetical protein
MLDEIHNYRDQMRKQLTAGISDEALGSQIASLLQMKANLAQQQPAAQAS